MGLRAGLLLCILVVTLCAPATPDGTRDTYETAHFMIHYQPGDYAQDIADALEQSWQTYHVVQPWDVPPSDGTEGGGIDKIDCYIVPLPAGAPGYVEPSEPVPGGAPYDYTADMFIDDDLASLAAIRVAVAHIYMHVVQYGYIWSAGGEWYCEQCAAMGEEWVFDDINDYRGYLPLFFSRPYQSLPESGLGGIVWPMYQSERFSTDLVESIWDRYQWSANLFASHDEILADQGYDTNSAYVEFIRWCFYTAERADGNHFEEAASWTVKLNPEQTFDAYPTGPIGPGNPPSPLGTNMLRFRQTVGSADNVLIVSFDGPPCTAAVQFISRQMGTGIFTEYEMPLDENGHGVIEIRHFDEIDCVFMLASMSRQCVGAQDFVCSAETRYDAHAPADDTSALTLVLDHCYPNPLRGATSLRYSLFFATEVELQVSDVNGRLILSQPAILQPAGVHLALWDGTDSRGRPVTNGRYQITVTAGDRRATRAVLVVR